METNGKFWKIIEDSFMKEPFTEVRVELKELIRDYSKASKDEWWLKSFITQDTVLLTLVWDVPGCELPHRKWKSFTAQTNHVLAGWLGYREGRGCVSQWPDLTVSQKAKKPGGVHRSPQKAEKAPDGHENKELDGGVAVKPSIALCSF